MLRRAVLKKPYLIDFTILIILFALISSCGRSGSGKTYTKFQIKASAIQSGIPQGGGILVLGHRLDDSHSFMIGLPDPNVEKIIELEKGPWEFYAIGWAGDTSISGNRQLTGTNRCGYVGVVDMTQNDQDVVFNLNKGNCTLAIPGEAGTVNDPDFFETFDSTLFRRIQVRSCLNLPTTLTSTSCTQGSGEEGLTRSYRIEYKGRTEKFNQFFQDETSLISKCINIPSQNFIRLPVGSATDSFIEPVLFAYQDDNCQGPPITYDFHDGFFSNNNLLNKSFKIDAFVNSNYSALFIEHNPQTPSAGEHFGPYGFGIDGDHVWTGSVPSSITGSPGMTFEEARIVNIESTNTSYITLDAGEAANFADFDEILWYVNEDDSNGCGSDFRPGMLHLNRIKSVNTGVTDRIELMDPITDYKLLNGTTDVLTKPANANLSLTIPATGFCSMQIVRVRNFNHLTLNGVTISPNAYSRTSGTGGILAMKVFNTLDLTGAASVVDGSFLGLDGTITVPHSCPTNRFCAYMGDGGFSGGEQGGAITMIWARNVDIFQNFSFISDGDPSGGNPGASAGHVSLSTQSLNLAAGNTLLMQSHGGAGTGGDGDEGAVVLEYCGGQSSFNGTKTLSLEDGGGTSFSGNIVEKSDFCF